jgi:hypothetical protein
MRAKGTLTPGGVFRVKRRIKRKRIKRKRMKLKRMKLKRGKNILRLS